ncbi:hypothetical protein HMN09_00495900 [Mycena chlorophos]|uniref:Uncharacterized protein n=1 Tax=Mycena chlorophos TaxID=658473 RepID=A0A8H6T9L0_MYCCL|nr:hypothetical protein HMN09_00495900 [Mycena chlorophos]
MSLTSRDEINLRALVRRLDKSAEDSQWPISGDTTYIKVQGALQNVKYARKLLANVELEDVDPSPKNALRYDEFKTILDRVDSFLKALEKKTTPKRTRPAPILPSIPLPPPEPEPIPIPPPVDALSPVADTDNLLLSASDDVSSPPVPTIILPTPESAAESLLLPSKPTKSTSTSTSLQPSASMQHATLRQREMVDQMATMSEQLKRNSLYFAELLEKDKRVMEGAESKLESNFDFMQKTRVMTRDLRGKTGGTTCLVLLIVVFVMLVFVMMIGLIRFSGR